MAEDVQISDDGSLVDSSGRQLLTDPETRSRLADALSATFVGSAEYEAANPVVAKATKFLRLPLQGVSGTASNSTDNRILTTLVTLPRALPPVDQISINVTTAATTGNARLLVYADEEGEPGALIRDLGVQAIDSTGVKDYAVSPALVLGPGRVHFAVQHEGLSGSVTYRGVASYGPTLASAAVEALGATNVGGVFKNGATPGSPPDPFGSHNGTSGAGVAFAVRFP